MAGELFDGERVRESLWNFLDSTETAALLLDLDFSVRAYTSRLTEMFEIIPADLSQPLCFLIEKAGIEDLFEVLEQLTGTAESIKRELRTEDNRWLEVRITIDRMSNREIVGLIVTFRDVTGHVRAEERLQVLDEQFQKTTELLEDQINLRTAELLRKNIELRRESEERKDLQKRMLELTVEQQRSLGQQLHDGLAQDLFATQMMVANLIKTARSGFSIKVAQLEDVQSYLKEAEKEARSLARGLVPVDFEEAEGLPAALHRMARRINELRQGLACWLECDEDLIIDNDFSALKLYHIAREAVNNAFMHAGASTIAIRLRSGSRGQIILEVEDNGVGIQEDDLESGPGIGIRIMRHRAEIIDAQLEIRRKPEGGTLVRCTLQPYLRQLSSA